MLLALSEQALRMFNREHHVPTLLWGLLCWPLWLNAAALPTPFSSLTRVSFKVVAPGHFFFFLFLFFCERTGCNVKRVI